MDPMCIRNLVPKPGTAETVVCMHGDEAYTFHGLRRLSNLKRSAASSCKVLQVNETSFCMYKPRIHCFVAVWL